jgi:hypothetical protein
MRVVSRVRNAATAVCGREERGIPPPDFSVFQAYGLPPSLESVNPSKRAARSSEILQLAFEHGEIELGFAPAFTRTQLLAGSAENGILADCR